MAQAVNAVFTQFPANLRPSAGGAARLVAGATKFPRQS